MGNLPLGGLPKNFVAIISAHPDMTLAVDYGHKVALQAEQQTRIFIIITGGKRNRKRRSRQGS